VTSDDVDFSVDQLSHEVKVLHQGSRLALAHIDDSCLAAFRPLDEIDCQDRLRLAGKEPCIAF
jgi:hypothetical protein